MSKITSINLAQISTPVNILLTTDAFSSFVLSGISFFKNGAITGTGDISISLADGTVVASIAVGMIGSNISSIENNLITLVTPTAYKNTLTIDKLPITLSSPATGLSGQITCFVDYKVLGILSQDLSINANALTTSDTILSNVNNTLVQTKYMLPASYVRDKDNFSGTNYNLTGLTDDLVILFNDANAAAQKTLALPMPDVNNTSLLYVINSGGNALPITISTTNGSALEPANASILPGSWALITGIVNGGGYPIWSIDTASPTPIVSQTEVLAPNVSSVTLFAPNTGGQYTLKTVTLGVTSNVAPSGGGYTGINILVGDLVFANFPAALITPNRRLNFESDPSVFVDSNFDFTQIANKTIAAAWAGGTPTSGKVSMLAEVVTYIA